MDSLCECLLMGDFNITALQTGKYPHVGTMEMLPLRPLALQDSLTCPAPGKLNTFIPERNPTTEWIKR